MNVVIVHVIAYFYFITLPILSILIERVVVTCNVDIVANTCKIEIVSVRPI